MVEVAVMSGLSKTSRPPGVDPFTSFRSSPKPSPLT